jgi:hypothetical protein
MQKEWKQWWDKATGLPCLAIRRSSLGVWCGYVGVPPGHALHGMDYDIPDVRIHGGLTFADCADPRGGHAPEEIDDVWWFGFDCAHAGDVIPGVNKHGKYRDRAYVEVECTSLAKQLARY